jgi:hypothetical protein
MRVVLKRQSRRVIVADANINRARLHLTVALDDVGVLNILLRQANTHKCICFCEIMNFKRCLGSTNSESGIEASVRSST